MGVLEEDTPTTAEAEEALRGTLTMRHLRIGMAVEGHSLTPVLRHRGHLPATMAMGEEDMGVVETAGIHTVTVDEEHPVCPAIQGGDNEADVIRFGIGHAILASSRGVLVNFGGLQTNMIPELEFFSIDASKWV